MHLVELLLPLYDSDGNPFPQEMLLQVQRELTERFGGATAHLRAPASGAWKQAGQVSRDDVVIVEVLVEELDRNFFGAYREELQGRFRQQELLVRATPCERL